MPLPAKRKTETAGRKKAGSKIGATSADTGKGPAKKKLSKPIAGLSADQMQGGEESEEAKASPKPRSSKGKAKGLY